MSIIASITPIDFEADVQEVQYLRKYAKRAVHHGLKVLNDGAPFNPDLMYHHFLRIFSNENERQIYKNLGSAWLKDSQEIHVYKDLGINQEMIEQVSNIKSFNPDTPIFLTSIKNNQKQEINLSQLKSIANAQLNIDLKTIDDYKLGYEATIQPEFTSTHKTPNNIPHFSKYKKVIMESPFAGDVENNLQYTQMSMSYLSKKFIAPSASHAKFTTLLDDLIKEDRELGIKSGLDIAHNVDTIVMTDRGYSNGIRYGLLRAEKEGRKISFATLSDDPKVIKEVSELKSFDDFVQYTDKKKQENQNLFEKTGYIVDIPELKALKLKSKSKIKP